MTTLLTDYTPEQHDWTPIPGFEHRYAISRHGFVFDAQKEKYISIYVHTKRYGKQAHQTKSYRKLTLNESPGVQRTVSLHRLLALTFLINPHAKTCIDHEDRDSLNNHLDNLRWASHAQNNQNQKIRTTGTSKYHGVVFDKGCGKWKAAIGLGGKTKNLGRFANELDAALAYDRAALAAGFRHHNGLIQLRLTA